MVHPAGPEAGRQRKWNPDGVEMCGPTDYHPNNTAHPLWWAINRCLYPKEKGPEHFAPAPPLALITTARFVQFGTIERCASRPTANELHPAGTRAGGDSVVARCGSRWMRPRDHTRRNDKRRNTGLEYRPHVFRRTLGGRIDATACRTCTVPLALSFLHT